VQGYLNQIQSETDERQLGTQPYYTSYRKEPR
jgi:hypothetical protein